MAEPRPAMKQSWQHVLFLHWEVEAEALARRLPPGLTLDTHQGRAFVGVVPFTMCGVRFLWHPSLPWISNFHETNVRTYVRCGNESGVFFFSLDAANPVAVAGARLAFSLPYFYARMRMDLSERAGAPPVIDYRTERLPPGPRPATCEARYAPEGEARTSAPGSLEHFLVERYSLFTVRGGQLYLGRVRHPPYPLQGARVERWSESLLQAAGIQRPDSEPLAHYAEGVDVDVMSLERVTPD
jgi:hypothetical protein